MRVDTRKLRVEREKNNHANEHINKSKSHLNKYIGCEDYVDARQKVLDRVDEVDELYPVPKKGRKSEDERIVAGIIITYCPQQIYDEGRSDEFFEKTHAVIMDFFGEKNVGGSMSHYDEIHDYVDAETKEERTSLAHMHTVVERGRAENEKGKCAVQKREQELNLEVERRTQERLEKTDDFQRLMQTSSAWEQRVAELHKSKGSKQQSEKATDEKAKPIASELKGEFSYEI